MELIGIFFVGCGLLILAGAAKAVRPDNTARALVLLIPPRLGIVPSFSLSRRVVRIGALTEAVLGTCALLIPRTETATLVVFSYAVFLCVTIYARTHGGALSTCGCFGRPDTPATRLHVVLNMVFLAIAVAVAVHPPNFTDLVALLGHQPWDGLPLVLASGVGVWLAYLALASLAALAAAQRAAGGRAREGLTT